MTKYYDNTMISTYRRCPRRFYFRHVRHWRPDSVQPPLAFGLAWHDAMDVVWGLAGKKDPEEILELANNMFYTTWIEQGMPEIDPYNPDAANRFSPRTPGVGQEMLYNYIRARVPRIADMEVLAIERPFMVALYQNSSEVAYIGRLDKVVKDGGRVDVWEHKTTTAYSKDYGFRFEFVDSFSPNSQVDGYAHAIHMMYGSDARRIVVDAALVHKKENDRFKAIPIERSTSMLDVWLRETRLWIERMQEDESHINDEGGMYGYLKNTDACWDFHTSCPYKDVCRFNPDPREIDTAPDGMVVDEWKPFDILGLNKESNDA